jgi:hypothetical protein
MCGRYALHDHVMRALVGCWCALGALPARAFFDAPYVSPATPVAGEMIAVKVYGGGCDAITSAPGYPQITPDGNAIRVVLFGFHQDNLDFCNYGEGRLTQPVDSCAEGSYTLQLDRTYIDFFGNPVTDNLGIVNFTVSQVSVVAANDA